MRIPGNFSRIHQSLQNLDETHTSKNLTHASPFFLSPLIYRTGTELTASIEYIIVSMFPPYIGITSQCRQPVVNIGTPSLVCCRTASTNFKFEQKMSLVSDRSALWSELFQGRGHHGRQPKWQLFVWAQVLWRWNGRRYQCPLLRRSMAIGFVFS